MMKGVTKLLCLSVERSPQDFQSASGRLFGVFRRKYTHTQQQKIADDSVNEVFCLFAFLFFKLFLFPVVSNCNQTSTNCFDLED